MNVQPKIDKITQDNCSSDLDFQMNFAYKGAFRSIGDVAKIMGLNERTVGLVLERALKKLRSPARSGNLRNFYDP